MELNIDFTFRNPVSRFFLKDFLKKKQNKTKTRLLQNESRYLLI